MVIQTRLVLILLLCLHSSFSIYGSSGMTGRSFGAELGLDASEIYAIQEGEGGELWLGTGNGLFRFDGHQFHHFRSETGLASALITFLAPLGEKGMLVVGGRPDYLYFLHEGSLLGKIKLPAGLGLSRILHFDRHGNRFLIKKESRIWELDLRRWKVSSWENADLLPVNGMLYRRDLPPLGWSGSGKLFSWEKGRLQPIEAGIGAVLQVANWSSDSLLLITEAGGFCADLRLEGMREIAPDQMSGVGDPESTFRDSEGGIWLVSEKNGLFLDEGKGMTRVSPDLLDDYCQINCWYEDAAGNIWIGTQGKGLACLGNGQFTNYTTRNGLRSDYITGLEMGGNQNLFVGTNAGCETMATENGKMSKTIEPLTSGYIDAIQRIGEEVFLSCKDCQPGQYDEIGLQGMPQERRWASMAQIDSIRIAIGYWGNSKILIREGESWRKETLFRGKVRFGRVNAINVHGDSLWLATSAGLWTCDLEDRILSQVEFRTDTKGVLPNCYDLAWDDAGRLYAAGQKGAYRRTGLDWQLLPGFLDRNAPCRALALDSYGRMWMGTSLGLCVQEEEGMHIFGSSNGLIGTDIRHLLVDEEGGLLWIGTTQGLSSLPLQSALPPVPERLRLISVKELEENQSLSLGGFSLPHDQNSLEIVFSAIYLSGPNEVEYQYRLAGRDSIWKSTAGNRVQLLSLSPGDYRFQVRCRLPGSLWSDARKIEFEVRAPFWQRLDFQLALLMALLLCMSLLFLYRTRILRKKEAEKRKHLHELHHLEQEVLRASLNPHFVFNALNSVQHFLLPHQDHAAIRFVRGLAALIRINLDSSRQKVIPLSKEIERLGSYLELEQTRLQEHLQYKVEVHSELTAEDPFIPNMILQPIVENAIWHGIAPARRPGMIVIEAFRREDGVLVIEVLDNGAGLNQPEVKSTLVSHKSRGLELIRQRIRIYDSRNQLKLLARPDGCSGALAQFELFSS